MNETPAGGIRRPLQPCKPFRLVFLPHTHHCNGLAGLDARMAWLKRMKPRLSDHSGSACGFSASWAASRVCATSVMAS